MKTVLESKAGTGSVKKGRIVGFQGSWGSGIALLKIEKDDGSVVTVPCENTTTVRSLEACFGGVIGGGHTVRTGLQAGYFNREIYYLMDDMGLLLGGFIPCEEAGAELVDAYEQGLEV